MSPLSRHNDNDFKLRKLPCWCRGRSTDNAARHGDDENWKLNSHENEKKESLSNDIPCNFSHLYKHFRAICRLFCRASNGNFIANEMAFQNIITHLAKRKLSEELLESAQSTFCQWKVSRKIGSRERSKRFIKTFIFHLFGRRLENNLFLKKKQRSCVGRSMINRKKNFD